MQAIIIAAGKGTRIYPISLTRPKPLFQLMGQTMIEYTLDQLQGLATEVILVLGYKGEMIQKRIGNRYKGMRIRYVWQKKQTGTGSAVTSALKYIDDKFLLLMGDDLYSRKDIKNILKKFPAIGAQEVKNPKSFGVITAKNGLMINLAEKPERPQSKLANTALYYFPKTIFKYAISKSARGEYEFTDYVKQFANDQKLNVYIAKEWMPIPYVWDFLSVSDMKLGKIKKENKGKLDKGAKITGKVSVQKGTIIKSETVINGPAYIGENCILDNCTIHSGTVVENNCKVGPYSEISHSIIGSGTTIGEKTIIKDSIIGYNCKIENNVKFLNRSKLGTVRVIMQDRLIDTNKKTLGSFIGDNVLIENNSIIAAGVKIYPKQKIKANSQILKDAT